MTEFLPTVNQLLDEAITHYRADRAENAELNDSDWVHRFGRWLEGENAEQSALLLAVALHRLAANLECEEVAETGWQHTTGLTITAEVAKSDPKVFEVLTSLGDGLNAWTVGRMSPFMAYRLDMAEDATPGFVLTVRGEFIPGEDGALWRNTVLREGEQL